MPENPGSRAQCFWKVRAWDKDGSHPTGAKPSWTMGFLSPGDWQASYISFRDASPVHKDPRRVPARARQVEGVLGGQKRPAGDLYDCCLGIYEMTNGRKVTHYSRRVDRLPPACLLPDV
jgi:alpha-L-rhamnosidase